MKDWGCDEGLEIEGGHCESDGVVVVVVVIVVAVKEIIWWLRLLVFFLVHVGFVNASSLELSKLHITLILAKSPSNFDTSFLPTQKTASLCSWPNHASNFTTIFLSVQDFKQIW